MNAKLLNTIDTGNKSVSTRSIVYAKTYVNSGTKPTTTKEISVAAPTHQGDLSG